MYSHRSIGMECRKGCAIMIILKIKRISSMSANFNLSHIILRASPYHAMEHLWLLLSAWEKEEGSITLPAGVQMPPSVVP